MDPKLYAGSRYCTPKPAGSWYGGSPDEIGAWRKSVRARLRRAFGLPGAAKRCPPDARMTETLRLRSYTREAVEFTTCPGLSAFGLS